MRPSAWLVVLALTAGPTLAGGEQAMTVEEEARALIGAQCVGGERRRPG